MYLQSGSVYLLSILFCFAETTNFRFDYTYYPIIDGWLKLHLIPMNWGDAWLKCDLEGSVLASPTDKNMISAMDSHWNLQNTTYCAFYTGVHATFSKGNYFSIDGISLAKMPVQWAADEPDNENNNEQCIVWTDGKIADVNCFDLFPYMCFKRKTNDMAITSCGTVDKEYELDFRTHSCYKFHDHSTMWYAAHMTCAAEGGYLAIINSAYEASILSKISKNYYNKNFQDSIDDVIHIGIHDLHVHGLWRTIHGSKIKETGYAEWHPNQPDDRYIPDLHCGAMTINGYLIRNSCSKYAPFICEKNPNSLVDIQ
ncbi:unnamed protein product [Euphydryas editha]|uniref:C-type lectin domain-containing protein n=1 Tax=Euphydryas editha TaxID=104508 RepID=A0AAU9V994_EUPED|nr:unnamed protein product [Euphydryas editha]